MQTGTTLPPGVPLAPGSRPKGELVLRVGPVRLGPSSRHPNRPSLVSIRWWGDAGPGTCLSLAPNSSEAVVFPVCCGPKYLIRYLKDMSSLVLHVDEAGSMVPLGRCVVDVRFLDVSRTVAGTFPLLLPQGVPQPTAAAPPHSPAMQPAGTLLRHMGTLDVRLDLGFSSTTTSSFELNEHLAAQHMQALATPRVPPSFAPGVVSASDQVLPPANHSHTEHPSRPPPGRPIHTSNRAPSASGLQAEQSNTPELLQVDLCQPLLTRLLSSFQRFCEVFDRWKASSSGPGALTVPGLLETLKTRRIIEFDMSPAQSHYMHHILDPLGDLACDSMDEVLLALRQGSEAGLRVRSRHLEAVVPLLAPLALHIQQSMVLVRKAFRQASGSLDLGQLAAVLREAVPVLEKQQARYLFAILAHLVPSVTGGEWSGSVVIGDIQAFLRLAESWGPAAQYAGPDQMRVLAAAASPSAIPRSRLPAAAPGVPAAGGPASSSTTSADAAAAGAGGRSGALKRLRERMQGSRLASAGGVQEAQQPRDSQGHVPPAHYGQALLPPYQPPLPTFKSMQPPSLPTLAPVPSASQQPAGAAPPVSAPEPMQELVRQAEALRQSLAQVASGRPPAPFSERALSQHQDQGFQEQDEVLRALRYVTVPQVAKDIVKGALLSTGAKGRARHRHRHRGRTAARHEGGEEGEHGERQGGRRVRGRRGAGQGSDGSLTDSGSSDGSDAWEGTSSGTSWEEEEEAAEWSEQQLLAQLFFARTEAEAAASGGAQGQQQLAQGPQGLQVQAHADHSEHEGAPAPAQQGQGGASVLQAPSTSTQLIHEPNTEPQLQLWIHSLQLPSSSLASISGAPGGSDLSVIVKCPLLPALTQRQHHALPLSSFQNTASDQLPAPGSNDASCALLRLCLPAPNPSSLPCPLALEVWQQRTQLVGLATLTLSPQPTSQSDAPSTPASPAAPPALPSPEQAPAAGWQVSASSSGTFPLTNPLLPGSEDEATLGTAGTSTTITLSAALHTPGPSATTAAPLPASQPHAYDAGMQQARNQPPGARPGTDSPGLIEVEAVRHSFRVTVGGARHLADAPDLRRVGCAVPLSRFLKYIYPGDAEPLFTEDVPCSAGPIFAASAVHSVTLTPEQDVGQALEALVVAASTARQAEPGSSSSPDPDAASSGLRFEVWDRWPVQVVPDSAAAGAGQVPEAPAPTLLGVAVMPLSQLADLSHRAQQQQQQQEQRDESRGAATVAEGSGASTADDGAESDSGRGQLQAAVDQRGQGAGPSNKAVTAPGPITSACTLLLPLQPVSDNITAVEAGASVPLLEIQLQYEAVPTAMLVPAPSQGQQQQQVMGGSGEPSGVRGRPAASGAGDAAAAAAGLDGLESGGAPPAAQGTGGPQPVDLPRTASLSVQVVQACGLQAAVLEAQAWMGSSAALLGRSHLVGPNPYASLALVQGGALKGRLPKMQTPYLAQSFCPEYHWQAVVSLSLDTPVLEALATQHLCVELWHHTSRSLAAALSTTPLAPAVLGTSSSGTSGTPARAGGGAGTAKGSAGAGRELPPPLQPAAVQDVLLGCGTHPLLQLLTKPQGINAWLPLKSQRGEPVGAVQLALSLTHVGDKPLDVCPDAAPPLVQVPWLLDLMPAAALQQVVAQAPWALLGATPSQLTAITPTLSVPQHLASTSTDPSAAASLPSGPSDSGADHVVPWKEGLPPGFGGQWSRLTLHVDQVVLPSPGAAAELRPRSYKYYATYTLPGSSEEVHTAAQVARMQQGGSATSAASWATAPAAAKPGVSSVPASWHVPLQHCGVHWVRADAELAAALVRLPLRLRVWRAHGRVARGASSTPSAAGPGNPSLSGPQMGGPWVSSVISGEAQVDLSPLVSAAAVRRHQPNTRWLSGSFTVVDPSAKLFANSRVQVRVLLELLPTTLPPASWLDRTAWNPRGPPLQQGPARLQPQAQAQALQEVQMQAQTQRRGAGVQEEDVPETGSPAPEAPAPTANDGATYIPQETDVEGARPSSTSTIPPAATADRPSGSPEQQQIVTGSTVTSLVAPSFMLDDDFMFSFRKDAVPAALVGASAGPSTAAGHTSLGQPQPSSSSLDAHGPDGEPAGSTGPPLRASGASEGGEDTASPELREALRRQLEELELLALGWQTRLAPSDADVVDKQASATSQPHKDSSKAAPAPQVSRASEPQVSPSSSAAPQQSGQPLPPAFKEGRPAPFVAVTCSEDEDDYVVWGGAPGSDTDDTDELLASKSRLEPDAPPRPKVMASEAGLRPGTTLTSLSFPFALGRARQREEGTGGEQGAEGASVREDTDDWMFGFSRPAAVPAVVDQSGAGPGASQDRPQPAAMHPFFPVVPQVAVVNAAAPAAASSVTQSWSSSPNPSASRSMVPLGTRGSIEAAKAAALDTSYNTNSPTAAGSLKSSTSEVTTTDTRAEGPDQPAARSPLLPAVHRPDALADLPVDAGVEVHRMQLPAASAGAEGAAPRIRFANTLPAIQPDFKLSYMG